MKKYRQSIIKKTGIIYGIAALLIAAFVTSMIITLGIYRNVNAKGTQAYTDIAKLYTDISNLDNAVANYNLYGGEHYANKTMEAFDEARSTVEYVHKYRYRYVEEVRYVVEDIQALFESVKSEVSQLVGQVTDDQIRNDNVLRPLVKAINNVSNSAYIALENCDQKYTAMISNAEKYMIFAIIFMVAVLLGFLATVIIMIHTLRNKIAKPIAETAEWAQLFDQDYAEMADLTPCKEDNELADLMRIFNRVKQALVEANRLKAENALALQRLHNEEEYHKKFVQKFHEEKREKDDISAKAKRDGLTGLYNRRSFDDLVEEFLRNRPANAQGALYLIDMDYFKNVNDTLGHIAGDEALKQLSGAMSVVFPGAYLGRYGGDEFVVFMTTGNDDLFRIKANELCHKMDRDFIFGDNSVHVSVSVGVASTEGVHDYSELYMIVDRALYYAKEHGRNQYKMAKDLND